MSTQESQSSGVQQLVDRLRDEGVLKGQEEAETLVAEARQKAVQILDEARAEVEEIRSQARADAEQTKQAGEEALRLAARDAVLELRESVNEDFAKKVKRLVSHTLGDQELLRQLILQIARKAMPDESAGPVQVLLPDHLVTLEELRANPEEVAEGTLSHFVLGLSGDILREGLSFDVADDSTPGMRLRLVDQDLEIELTDETITALLIQHLVPRFAAIMERQDS